MTLDERARLLCMGMIGTLEEDVEFVKRHLREAVEEDRVEFRDLRIMAPNNQAPTAADALKAVRALIVNLQTEDADFTYMLEGISDILEGLRDTGPAKAIIGEDSGFNHSTTGGCV
jgi:hypothetical protein